MFSRSSRGNMPEKECHDVSRHRNRFDSQREHRNNRNHFGRSVESQAQITDAEKIATATEVGENIYRLEPVAPPYDARWDQAPSLGTVIVAARTAGDARIVAAGAELDFQEIDALPAEEVSTRNASAFEMRRRTLSLKWNTGGRACSEACSMVRVRSTPFDRRKFERADGARWKSSVLSATLSNKRRFRGRNRSILRHWPRASKACRRRWLRSRAGSRRASNSRCRGGTATDGLYR